MGAVHSIIMEIFEKQEEVKKEDDDFQDSVPWSSLASLAMFKLLNEWTSNGFKIPHSLRVTESAFSEEGQKSYYPVKKQDIDFTSEVGAFHEFNQMKTEQQIEGKIEKHPVSFLLEKNRTNPPSFTCSAEGNKPKQMFTVICKIKDETFVGKSRSKKEAKKIAAT